MKVYALYPNSRSYETDKLEVIMKGNGGTIYRVDQTLALKVFHRNRFSNHPKGSYETLNYLTHLKNDSFILPTGLAYDDNPQFVGYTMHYVAPNFDLEKELNRDLKRVIYDLQALKQGVLALSHYHILLHDLESSHINYDQGYQFYDCSLLQYLPGSPTYELKEKNMAMVDHFMKSLWQIDCAHEINLETYLIKEGSGKVKTLNQLKK